MERSRLQQARTLAIRRQDYTEVATISAKLAAVDAALPPWDWGHPAQGQWRTQFRGERAA
ncbi:hypothetical protein C8Q74DRAFT_1280575 [Fomes fomentarius]|nr:hypothetical protein C8Q74DRAFT_1280575 [Fomes fomentarius]